MSDVTNFRTRKPPSEPQAPHGFGCGAVVRLRGSRIAMTVRSSVVSAENKLPMVKTDWMLDSGELCSCDFYVAQLDRVEELPVDDVEGDEAE